MREHIRQVIDEVQRPPEHDGRRGLEARREPGLRLASEAIRLARLAASTHMILSARLMAEAEPDTASARREQ